MTKQNKDTVQNHDIDKVKKRTRLPFKTLHEESPPQFGENTAIEQVVGNSAMDVPVQRHAKMLGATRLSHAASEAQKARLMSQIQQRYGNTHVQRLLKSRAVQAKLTINPPDDQYEKEADRVAAAFTQTPEPRIQGQPEAEKEDEKVRMKAASSEVQEVSQELETRINAVHGSGQPLPESARASLETHLQRDLSQVRVHTDAEADEVSQELQAKAFTKGQDIFFTEDAYQPNSEYGKKLLGHEVTHVVQQGEASHVASTIQRAASGPRKGNNWGMEVVVPRETIPKGTEVEAEAIWTVDSIVRDNLNRFSLQVNIAAEQFQSWYKSYPRQVDAFSIILNVAQSICTLLSAADPFAKGATIAEGIVGLFATAYEQVAEDPNKDIDNLADALVRKMNAIANEGLNSIFVSPSEVIKKKQSDVWLDLVFARMENNPKELEETLYTKCGVPDPSIDYGTEILAKMIATFREEELKLKYRFKKLRKGKAEELQTESQKEAEELMASSKGSRRR